MYQTDILIIGAGVVGLAVARELSLAKKNVIVAEKSGSFGQETSSRNSEVIHGGMYYPSGTLKAKLCVTGRQILYELCEKNGIPHRKTGKLIVAADKSEIPALEGIYSQGRENGVEGLRMLSKEEIKAVEPNISGEEALYSAETGIIDSHSLMEYFLEVAEANGVIVVYGSEVTGIGRTNSGYKVEVRNSGENAKIRASVVVNCAGLDSDTIACMAGIDIVKHQYSLSYCKGEYFRVSPAKGKLIKHLVYPVPRPKSGGLGVHATLDLGGGMKLGPDDTYLESRDKDYSVNGKKRNEFYISAAKFLLFLEESDLTPDTAGIRPKLQVKGGPFRDFIIRDEADKGLPGFINLIGIESPGLTASAAIAEYVRGLIR